MHEVIFHFPCSISWHGKAAGLCPRSSCISSPGKRFLRAAGPDPQRNSLPPSLPPAPAAAQRRRMRPDPIQLHLGCSEKRALLLFIVPPPRVCVIMSAWLPLRRAGAGGGDRGGSAPLRAPPRTAAAWSHSAPYWGRAAPPAPRPRKGPPRWRRGARSCAAEGGWWWWDPCLVFSCHASGCFWGSSPSCFHPHFRSLAIIFCLIIIFFPAFFNVSASAVNTVRTESPG